MIVSRVIRVEQALARLCADEDVNLHQVIAVAREMQRRHDEPETVPKAEAGK